jgi:hypothetical protein
VGKYGSAKSTQTNSATLWSFANLPLKQPPESGDSAAWICKEVGTDSQWAALVVGAHDLNDWWESLSL